MRDGVSAFREAISLDPDHPSVSFLVHVATIEGIRERLVPRLDRCAKCGSPTGAGRRFRAALESALTEDEIRRLHGAYDLRSATGHRGALHGAEFTQGISGLSMFRSNPAMEFEYRGPMPICEASRQVIAQAIRVALGIPRPPRAEPAADR